VLGRGTVALVLGLLLLAVVSGLGVGALLAGQREAAGSGALPPVGTAATPTPSGEPGATVAASGDGSLSVAVDRTSAAAGERFTLSGALDGAEAGVAVRVQRQEGGAWTDFPAQSTTAADGTYTLPVELGRDGENVLRVVAPSAGAQSDPVTVTIG
jgi:hypothetical protein